MATTITHGFVAAALGKLVFPERMPARFWLLTLGCALLPDLDVVAFRLGIAYRSALGHRGFLHSLLFAALTGIAVTLLAFRGERRFSRRWWSLAGFFVLVTASHGLLDAMTNGGYGTGFFIPFDNKRYFLPWRPLQVSPIGISGVLSMRGLHVLLNELLVVWLPFSCLLGLVLLLRSRRTSDPLRNSGKVL